MSTVFFTCLVSSLIWKPFVGKRFASGALTKAFITRHHSSLSSCGATGSRRAEFSRFHTPHSCNSNVRLLRRTPPFRTRVVSSFVSSTGPFFMSATEDSDDDEKEDFGKNVESVWNIPGLKKEVARSILRCHKKLSKNSVRFAKAQELTTVANNNNDNTRRDTLENYPSLDEIRLEAHELQQRLQNLNALEAALQQIKKQQAVLPKTIAALAVSLRVNDEPVARPPRGPAKPKGPRGGSSHPRLPYRRYYSFDNIEIRVGKRATDNDELTLSPAHRDPDDWWLHAAGCPGSHVVIRVAGRAPATDLSRDVLLDAAALAARHSKCRGNGINVSVTKCRDITKPPGAPPGLVQLTGHIRTVAVNMKEAAARLERLDATVCVN